MGRMERDAALFTRRGLGRDLTLYYVNKGALPVKLSCLHSHFVGLFEAGQTVPRKTRLT